MALTTSNTAESNLKRRCAFTNLKRRNIQQRHIDHPGPQAALISWFIAETGHKINQSQISKILLKDYEYLDNPNQKKPTLGSKRHYQGDWPELKAALFKWQQCIQKKKATITGDILRAKAAEL
jgi:hypothetical protein